MNEGFEKGFDMRSSSELLEVYGDLKGSLLKLMTTTVLPTNGKGLKMSTQVRLLLSDFIYWFFDFRKPTYYRHLNVNNGVHLSAAL